MVKKKIVNKTYLILNENLSILKKKYNFVILENTYLSNPSRLIEIMKVDKNEDYIHLDISNLKTITKKKIEFSYKNLGKNEQK